eukprot:jgi/Botrbrau1/23426/Bobra.0051s0067.1
MEVILKFSCHFITRKRRRKEDYIQRPATRAEEEKAPLTHSNILNVYALAQKYDFSAASNICEDLMADNLNSLNVLEILTLKHTLGAYGAECAEPFLKYAATSMSVMASLKEMCLLPIEVLGDILRRDDICLSSESLVLEIIKAWCSHRYHDREKSVGSSDDAFIPEELWKCIRLDVADAPSLAKLLNDSTLCLSAPRFLEVGRAAVALNSRTNMPATFPDSRKTVAFYYTIPIALFNARAAASDLTARMCHCDRYWDWWIHCKHLRNGKASVIVFGPNVPSDLKQAPIDALWRMGEVVIDVQLRRVGEGEFKKPAWSEHSIEAVTADFNAEKSEVRAKFSLKGFLTDGIDGFDALRVSFVFNSPLGIVLKNNKIIGNPPPESSNAIADR